MNVRHPITGCAYQSLTGLWPIEARAFAALIEHVHGLDLKALAELNAAAEAREREEASRRPADQPPPKPYDLYAANGRAVIHVTGPTTKYPTSFARVLGGTSTMMVERALTAAVADDQVKSILMRYETPGGTWAGSAELVDRIRWARAQKPLDSHIDDVGTSGGMLYSVQGRRVTANRTAVVGSIGVLGQPLVDRSGELAAKGIVVHQIACGRWKTLGAPGASVTAEQVAEASRIIESVGAQFFAEIASARRVTPAYVRSLEAALFTAEEGRERNLIDDVCSFEQALASAA